MNDRVVEVANRGHRHFVHQILWNLRELLGMVVAELEWGSKDNNRDMGDMMDGLLIVALRHSVLRVAVEVVAWHRGNTNSDWYCFLSHCHFVRATGTWHGQMARLDYRHCHRPAVADTRDMHRDMGRGHNLRGLVLVVVWDLNILNLTNSARTTRLSSPVRQRRYYKILYEYQISTHHSSLRRYTLLNLFLDHLINVFFQI